MKNNINFSVISFIICMFWLAVYIVGKQMLAAYLAILFGLIVILIVSWILLKILLMVGMQSSEEIDRLESKSMVKKSSIKIS